MMLHLFVAPKFLNHLHNLMDCIPHLAMQASQASYSDQHRACGVYVAGLGQRRTLEVQ